MASSAISVIDIFSSATFSLKETVCFVKKKEWDFCLAVLEDEYLEIDGSTAPTKEQAKSAKFTHCGGVHAIGRMPQLFSRIERVMKRAR